MVIQTFFNQVFKGCSSCFKSTKWINLVLQLRTRKALPIDRLQLFMQANSNTQNPGCPFIVNKDAESADFKTSSP